MDSFHQGLSLNGSVANLSLTLNNSVKTPHRGAGCVGGGNIKAALGTSINNITPGRSAKTPTNPSKSVGSKLNKSGGAGGSRKASSAGGDRFMPGRSNFEMASYLLTQNTENKDNSKAQAPPTSSNSGYGSGSGEDSNNQQPTEFEQEVPTRKLESSYSRSLTESLLGVTDLTQTRILSFAQKPSCPPEGYQNALKVIYQGSSSSAHASQNPATKYRVLPKTPERVLDAPDVIDDFYLNILDWSKGNVVGIALGDQVYLWTAHSAEITKIPCDKHDAHLGMVTSVAFVQDGGHVVCGLDTGAMQVWDVTAKKIVRTMRTSDTTARIPVISLESYVLSEGNRLGHLRHHDLRAANHEICKIENAHSQEICGLKWSLDGRFYSSGGNDNLVHIWDRAALNSSAKPVCTFTQHVAAVKAMSWSPMNLSVLATGGGTNDRTIKIWNVASGNLLKDVNTLSQVSGLSWNEGYREIVSSHGFNRHQLTCWKYPEMSKVGEMTGHTSRIINLAQSPDSTTIATVSGDETLRFWRVFPPTRSEMSKTKAKETTSEFASFKHLR